MAKSVVTVTEAAAERLVSALAATPGAKVRLSVKTGGCAGMEYALETVTDASAGDMEVEGAPLIVEGKSLMFLLGMTLDYRTEGLSSRFEFDNPNQTAACGCGESVAIKPCAA